MKKRTLKKLLVLMLSIVMMLTIVPTSANESSVAYDYSWMDEYTDEEFLAISGLTKEEWKVEYPDLTFEDFNIVQTYAHGAGVTYDFGGTEVYCISEDHPFAGRLTDGSNYIVNCCLKSAASPASWSPDMVDDVSWTNGSAPLSFRDYYWELYKGLYPNYDNGIARYNEQGISQGETTGFGGLTVALTGVTSNTTTAPYASAFNATSTSGSSVANGGTLTVTKDTSTQKTATITLNTGTSYIHTSVSVPAGVTINYNAGAGWQSDTNSTGAAKTYVLSNGTQVYFTAPLSRASSDTITFSSVVGLNGTYQTGYYIGDVYTLTPGGPLTSTNNGQTYNLQILCYPTARAANYSLIAPWVAYGSLKIVKTSSNPSVSDGNACYSLQGAVYTVYRYASDAQAGTNPYGTITLDANGEGVLNNIPAGTYYVKETTAPKGYALNSAISTVTVNSGATAVHNTQDTPQMDPARILLEKQGKNGMGLEGAEFTLKFYEDVNLTTDPALSGYTANRTWVIKTGANGTSALMDEFKVSGDAFYTNLSGIVMLPLGTLTIQETKAPDGYIIDDTMYVRTITASGTAESVDTYNAPVISNEIMQAPFALKKLGEAPDGTEITLSGAGFMACNVADLEVDENGDYIFDEDKAIVLTTEGDKELFTDEEGYAESIKLDFGTYLVRETSVPDYHIACEDFTVVIDTNSDEPAEVKEIKNDAKYPSVITTAVDVTSGGHTGVIMVDAKVDDIVECSDLIIGREYTLYGIAMDKDTEKELLIDGKTVTSTITFEATDVDMEVKVPFKLDASNLNGKTTVYCEYLYEGSSVEDGKLLFSHDDIENVDQTIYYPSVGTKATDSVTNTNIGTISEKTTIIDKVTYENLIVGKEYTVTGKQMVKDTELPLIIDGKEVTASTTFVAQTPNGSVDIVFTFDSSALQGQAIVAFEDVYVDGIKVVSHADINDEGQTITFPPTPDEPGTGDGTPIILLILIMLTSIGTICVLLGISKIDTWIKQKLSKNDK